MGHVEVVVINYATVYRYMNAFDLSSLVRPFVPIGLEPYAVAALVFLGALIIFAILQRVVLGRLERAAVRSKTLIDDAIVAMLRSVHPTFYWFISIYLALRYFTLTPVAATALNTLFWGWMLYQIVRSVSVGADLLMAGKDTTEGERNARHLLSITLKVTLWSIALLLLLSNLGFDISSLIAGLGIGGVAIAFALQNILGDLFSSFAIYLDKPFEVGDFIIVGDKMGTVVQIGIKTTRLIALQGEEVVLSNQELTSARIQNFKKMQERRVSSSIGVLYETPRETLATLPEKIKSAIATVHGVRVDRVHLAGFGDSSIDFELVYYVATGDYTVYMDCQQAINLALLELFEREKVYFAYPTRTIYTAKV